MRLVHLEDLIISKVLAGRPKDLEDVRALWRVHATGLDRDRIRRVLGQLEEALSQSDLVPTFEAIVATRP